MPTHLTCALHLAILLALCAALGEAAPNYTLNVEYFDNQEMIEQRIVTFPQWINANSLLNKLVEEGKFKYRLANWENLLGHTAPPALGLYFKDSRGVMNPLAKSENVWQQVNSYLTEQEKHAARPDSEAGTKPELKEEPATNEGLALVVKFDDFCKVWTYFIINKEYSMSTKITIDSTMTVRKLLGEEIPKDETFKKARAEWEEKNPDAPQIFLNLYIRDLERRINSSRLDPEKSVFDQANAFLGLDHPLTTCKGLAHNGHAALVVALGHVSDSSPTGNSAEKKGKNLPIAEPNNLTVDDLKRPWLC